MVRAYVCVHVYVYIDMLKHIDKSDQIRMSSPDEMSQGEVVFRQSESRRIVVQPNRIFVTVEVRTNRVKTNFSDH